MSQNKKNTSRLIKKLGITFVIPFLMLIMGVLIIFSAGWGIITQGFSLGAILFSKPTLNIEERQFTINNVQINRPGIGEEFATLEIPSLDFSSSVIHGDSDAELRRGIGHFAGSTLPGENGNIIISAHRDTAFKALEHIKTDDEVLFTTEYGTYKYKVSEIKIVDDEDNYELRVLDYERLTMYTCYPFNFIGSAPNRMIVICDFVEVL